MGNRAPPCEGNGDIGRRDVLREFGDGQHVETARGEESGADVAAHAFDGCADGFKPIIRMLRNAGPSIGSKADLMAKVGHAASQSSGGRGLCGFFESGPVRGGCQVKS